MDLASLVELARGRRVVALTGAGCSTESGIPDYRGIDTPPRPRAPLQHREFVDKEDNRRRYWARSLLGWPRLAASQPNAGHRAIAALEHAGVIAGVITQNVDSLHTRAGNKHVCELHGSLARWRCESCGVEQNLPTDPQHCGRTMRPSVVLFGEEIPAAAEHTAKRALRDCDLFVAIGTSGTVSPAASFVRWAEYAGARRVLLNLEIDPEAHDHFSETHAGASDELVPKFFS